MNWLKKFWEKCGEEKFTVQLIAAACTGLTIYNLLFLDVYPELKILMVLLNCLLILAAVFEED